MYYAIYKNSLTYRWPKEDHRDVLWRLIHGKHPPIGVYGLKEYPKKMSYLSRNQRIATDMVRKARLAINQLTKPWEKVNKPKS